MDYISREYLGIRMMGDSLKSKTIRGLSWSFIELAGIQIVQFVTGIILARLLFPEQFGLIGMIMVFIAVAQTFSDSGFGDALIQKREATITDTCSIFYFNIAVGLGAAGLLCLIAPWISAFYQQQVLTPITRVLSLIIVIESFGLIQSTILIKRVDFKTQMKIGIIALVLSAIIGIAMATAGFGVWSLVAQQLSRSLIRTSCLWIFNSWRPNLIFSFNALQEMFGYGSRLLLSSLLNRIFDNLYYLIIGRLFSPRELGLYTRGKAMQDLPSGTFSQMVTRVTFPIFSSIQDDKTRIQRLLEKASVNMAMVNFPMMIGLALVSRPLVLLLLTEKWAGAIPYMQLLCVASLLTPFRWINMNIMLSTGRSKLYLKIGIINKILIVISIAVTWRYGINAMIIGGIVAGLIMHYINNYYISLLLAYPIRKQFQDISPYLIMAILMGILVYLVGFFPFKKQIGLLLAQMSVGVFIYTFLCRMFRLTSFMEIWQAGWNKIYFYMRIGAL